nr:hypothetical protein [Tanacetum cinerariifolium]
MPTGKQNSEKYHQESSATIQTIFHLPQATDNNHDSFVPPPSFYDMIPIYKNQLGFTMELKTPSNFKTIGLLQSWKTAAMGRNSLFSSSFTSLIPYPRFTKIIIGRYKDKVGMKIPDWMITEAMKQTKYYMMSPTLKVDASGPTRSTMIHLLLPQWRSTRLTPPSLVLIVDKTDELILQDTLQVNLAKYKSRQEQEAKENVALVDEHLASLEIEKMVEGQEHVVDDSSIPRNDEHNIPDTRLEPTSDKESPEELQGCYGYLFQHLKERFMPHKSFGTLANHLHDAMTESLPVMVDKHVKEQVKQQVPKQVHNQVPVYVVEGLILKRKKTKEEMEKMIAKAILQERGNIQAQISSQIQQAIVKAIPSQVDVSVRSCMYGNILHVHPAQPQTTSVPEQQYQLTPAVRLRDQDVPHDDAHPEGEKSTKRQKRSEYEAYVSGESSSG